MRLIFPSHGTIPTPERLVLRGGRRTRVPLAIRYGVLLREGHGPVLVDAGWPEPRAGDSRPLCLYRRALGARLRPERHPLAVLRDLSHGPGDVEAIALTHLHADHVGALRDFPDAPIHAPLEALRRATRGGLGVLRHGVFAELLPADALARATDVGGEEVELPHGLGRGRDVLGDGSMVSVDLPGHADGHTGYLFPRFDPPVLFAADAQWVLAALRENRPPRGPARLVYSDRAAVEPTVRRVRRFERGGGRVVLAHDPEPVPDFAA